MNVAIVGSREYKNLQLVRDYVYALPAGTLIISGGARGVDATAEAAARQRGLHVVIYKADWNKGRGAGYVRNYDIVAAADRVVAFWDGQSRGTAHTMSIARNMNRPLEVFDSSECASGLLDFI